MSFDCSEQSLCALPPPLGAMQANVEWLVLQLQLFQLQDSMGQYGLGAAHGKHR